MEAVGIHMKKPTAFTLTKVYTLSVYAHTTFSPTENTEQFQTYFAGETVRKWTGPDTSGVRVSDTNSTCTYPFTWQSSCRPQSITLTTSREMSKTQSSH